MSYEPDLDNLERMARESRCPTVLTPYTTLWLIERVRAAESQLSAATARASELEREARKWIAGSPEVAGQYWIYWRTLQGEWRVESASIGPALFSKAGALLLKFSSGAAFQYEPNRKAITHYMPIEAAPLPPGGKTNG